MAARGKEKNMIACGARSYRVGDLMLGLPSSGKAGELILIVRESGHPRYFYGLDCSTGEEHLFNLEYFCGYDET